MPDKLGDYVIHDPRFQNLVLGPHVTVERIWNEGRWCEGPVWLADMETLIWSDIPNNRMMKWSENSGCHIFRAPSNYANGNTRDQLGRLITCEHGSRSVTRTEHDGSISVLASHFAQKKLNSPNDVAVAPDGAVWFTDPDYGIMTDYEGTKSEREQSGCFVYRIDPSSGQVDSVIEQLERPNGIAFSPNGRKLYVSDTGKSHNPNGNGFIQVFDVDAGKKAKRGKFFAAPQMGLSDGFRLDIHGNIWTSAGNGVDCFSENGELLGSITIPEQVSNCEFGGPKLNRLFITATKSVYSVFLNTKGHKFMRGNDADIT